MSLHRHYLGETRMRFAERLALELVLPRRLPMFLVWPGRIIAVLILLWGLAVCIAITLAAVAAILGI